MRKRTWSIDYFTRTDYCLLISLADQPPLRLLQAVTAWTGNITCKWNIQTFFFLFNNFYFSDLCICWVDISCGLTLPDSVEGLNYDCSSLYPAGAKTALRGRVIFNRRSRWSYFWVGCKYINIIYSRLVLSLFWWVASVFEAQSSWTLRNWPTTPPSNVIYMNYMLTRVRGLSFIHEIIFMFTFFCVIVALFLDLRPIM